MVAASQASHEAQRPNYTGQRGAQWGGRPDPEPSAGAPSSRDRTGPLGRRAVDASWGRLSSCLVQPLLRLRWPPGRAVPCPWQDNGRAAACRQLVPNGASRSGWDTLAFTRRDRPLKQSQAEPQGPLSLVGVCHQAPRPSFT